MAFETNWPNWLRDLWPQWIEEVGFPASGVGDLQDLKLNLRVGNSGRWIGLVNTGWFYHENLEQYNYALRGSQQTSASAASGVLTASLSYRPSWGPVMISSLQPGSAFLPYVQHANSFAPATPLSWSVVDSTLGIYAATVPVSAIVVGMRNLTNLPMGAVAASGYVISENLYSYDVANRKIYIKPKDPASITIWADLLYSYPRLKMREVVIETEDGVKASYNNITNVTVSRGNQSYTHATDVGSGYITHTLSGLHNGDWVVLDYFIKNSFIVVDHQTIHYYTSPTSGDTIRVDFETSIPDVIPALTLSATGASYNGDLNLNPVFADSHRAGYLFHSWPTTPASGLWSVSSISIGIDKLIFNRYWNEPLRVSVLCVGDNGLPVPWAPITVSITSGCTALIQTPASTYTDGRGEYHAIIMPASGTSLFTIQVTSGTASATKSATGLTTDIVRPARLYRDGHVVTVITDQRSQRGYWQGYVNRTFLDGIPYAGSAIILNSLKASPIEVGNTINLRSAQISTTQDHLNICAIKSFGYLPQPGDQLAGRAERGQSQIIETEDDS